MKVEPIDSLDSYRLLNGVAVDLRVATPAARQFLADLALRLAQGEGYTELLLRVQRPDSPLYEGQSPLAPAALDLAALRAARDMVYRAGVAEGHIATASTDNVLRMLPTGSRLTAMAGGGGRDGKLTTEPIVTVGEAMEMLDITRQAVINAVRAGRIRGEQHGKLWVLAREDVLRYRMARDDRRLARQAG